MYDFRSRTASRERDGRGFRRRARLLDATIRLLDTAGPEAATSRAIADAAGQIASITYYFGSKRDLVDEAMVTAARRLIQPVVAEFADDGRDGITKLLRVPSSSSTASSTNMRVSSVRTSTPLLRPQPTRQSPPRCDHCTAELSSVLAAEIVAQQQHGLLPDWVQADSMAQLIVSLVNGVAVSIAFDPDGTQPTAVGSQFTQLLLAVRAPTP